ILGGRRRNKVVRPSAALGFPQTGRSARCRTLPPLWRGSTRAGAREGCAVTLHLGLLLADAVTVPLGGVATAARHGAETISADDEAATKVAVVEGFLGCGLVHRPGPLCSVPGRFAPRPTRERGWRAGLACGPGVRAWRAGLACGPGVRA